MRAANAQHLSVNQNVIVKPDAKRSTQVPPFDQAKDTIRKRLQLRTLATASSQFVGEQLKRASIRQ